MSEAKQRLLQSWQRLTHHCIAAVVSACEASHSPLTGTSKSHPNPDAPQHYEIGIDTHCEPAATGTLGQVRVGLPAQNFVVQLSNPLLVHPLPQYAALTAAVGGIPTKSPHELPVGLDYILVEIEAAQAVPTGLYLGRVTDPTGAIDSPFVIFLDGLP